MRLGRLTPWLLTSAFLTIMLAGGCVIKKDSPAPGCIEYWGPASIGGCFGTTAILDLKVEPQTDCLEITVNNCNGGILEVSNTCAEMLALNQITIHPGERHVGLDLDRQNGEHVLISVDSNFSEYIPEEAELVEIQGMLGGREVRISFVKTKELC
ncbi:MAG TPA: hypothetical protein VMW58_03540 [Anaerolineae bacterium]|nr:hypothetical protein [Anaerolineae bacterium]